MRTLLTQTAKKAALALILVLLVADMASAVQKVYDIPPQSLRSALLLFQEQSGLDLAYPDSLVHGKTTRGVSGKTTDMDALSQILRGSGLSYARTGRGVVLREASPEKPTVMEDTERTSPERKVKAQRSVKLDDVVVTATKTEMKTQEVPASVDVVTSDDLETKSNANNLYDALRSTPGVQIKGTGTGLDSSEIFIRGHRPGILINGRDSKQFSDNYTFNSNFVDTGAVERIEVLKGPQSTMHGGRSVSGVVNIIMKKGDKDNKFINLRSAACSGDALQGSVTIGGGVDKFSYIVSYLADKKDKFITPVGRIPYNYLKRQNFYTRLDYDVAEGHALTFDYTYNKVEHASGGEEQMFSLLPVRSKGIYGTDKPNILQSAYLSYDGKFNDIFSVYSTFGIGEQDLNYIYGTSDYGNTIEKSYLTKENYTTRTNKILYGEIRGSFTFDKFKIITGFQGRQAKLDWDIIEDYSPYNSIRETERYIAPYAQIEYRPVEQVLAIAGARYDKFSYDKSNAKSAVSPRASLSYMPFAGTSYDYTTLWASYTESFNPPSANHLFGYINWADPNPNIKPERAKGYEIGIKQRISEWGNLEFSYFDTKYRDKIAMRPSNTPLTRMFQNINKAEIKGYEAKLEIYPADWITFFINYTDFNKRDGQDNSRLDEGTANEILQYGLSINNFYGFYANLSATRMSDYRNMKSYQRLLGENHPSNGATIVDTKISYKYEFNNGLSIEPFFAVNNLTNKAYYEGWLPAMAEKRNYQTGLNFRMNF